MPVTSVLRRQGTWSSRPAWAYIVRPRLKKSKIEQKAKRKEANRHAKQQPGTLRWGEKGGPLPRTHCEKRKVIPESMCSDPYKNINLEKPPGLGRCEQI